MPISPSELFQTRSVLCDGAMGTMLYGNGTLYVSGQQKQPDGLFEGFLTVVNLTSNQVSGTYPISDGIHTKMLFGDDNTLWIGSQQCATGERTAKDLINQVTGGIDNGCLTMFNMNVPPNADPTNRNPYVEPAYGDLTGLAAIRQWHKMYTAYGGQIHIYATTNAGITTSTHTYSAGTELYNGNATVQGTAYDVAYMDAITNASD